MTRIRRMGADFFSAIQVMKRLGRILTLATWVAIGIACQARDMSWEQVQAAGVLRVGLDPTYPPFETADDGGLRGLDVDLARALAADLGLRAEFVFLGYDGLYDALATEQVDALISALVVAPERTRDFAYSDSYFNAGQVLVTPAAETDIEIMADLDGRRLAVELGSQGHVEATTWARRLPFMQILTYNSAELALAAVTNGPADAALVDQVSGRLYVKEHRELQVSKQTVTLEPYALVVRIEDGVLLEKLNDSLRHLQESGRLAEIVGRWLDE